MNTIIIFSLLQFTNVIFSTIRSILTIKGGKIAATLSNALYFGYYTVVLIYTVADFPLWIKVSVTVITNFIGVYLVKMIEEKKKKEKLWRIDATIKENDINTVIEKIKKINVTFNTTKTLNKNNYILNCYCYSKQDTNKTLQILKQNKAKYFIIENRLPF